ncbi:MAG: cobaltochelatase subunit CobN [Cyanophyceae cyanobacterium]
MHRLAAVPGGWDASLEGVIFVEQSPAPVVVLTAKDTDIQTLAAAIAPLPADFPMVRAANLLQLQQQLTIDTYLEDVLNHAKVIVLRLLGGRAYWSYGLEVVERAARDRGIALLVLPGDDRPDPDLMASSTVPLTEVHQIWRYLNEGGVENARHALMALSDRHLGTAYGPPPPRSVPKVGFYDPKFFSDQAAQNTASGPTVGLLFYRAHFQSGNTAAIDALCLALIQRGLNPCPYFVSSLQDPEVQGELLTHLAEVDCLMTTTGFAIARPGETTQSSLWEKLNVPVIQAILSGGTAAQWAAGNFGLAPRDMAMNVALPEVDGRIVGRAIAFKAVHRRDERLETEVVGVEPLGDRVEFVADLALRWCDLRRSAVGDRRVALILANYPNRDGRLANGVGLDTPESCVEILQSLATAGYDLGQDHSNPFPLPKTGDELIQMLTAGMTNDPGFFHGRAINQALKRADYQTWFETLPEAVQRGIRDRWGDEPMADWGESLPIAGIQWGNIFVGIQPSRGYDRDPSLNYHAPDLEPAHEYLAFYEWLRSRFQVQAIVHVGKHGNLEWLPGKSIALSEQCYPEVALGAYPHFYPFIVNDPGEGSQAKRRAQAVILDHLTPPLTRAELYGNLEKLEGLIDEYYEAQSLDPKRTQAVAERVAELVKSEHLDQDLAARSRGNSSANLAKDQAEDWVTALDGYLCDLKEAQIRDGLHILGRCPEGTQLRDLIIAIARLGHPGVLGLTRAIARDWGLGLDPLTDDLAESLTNQDQEILQAQPGQSSTIRTVGDAIALLEQEAIKQVEFLLGNIEPNSNNTPGPQTALVLNWIRDRLLLNLRRCDREIHNLLKGLNGEFIPAGPSGAPTRGRPEVLPTGRNFYSVDLRALPTESAWAVGRAAAETLVEQYTQDHGDYPKTLGLSVWGTATMRTGGDDIAEALALLGVRPQWDGAARRVVGFEILSISQIGRPRVDVTLRISGFFRDAFPNLIDLFDRAVRAVADLDESPDDNPLADRVRQETAQGQGAGLGESQARDRARYRIFGSKPGAYGAGLQGLIEAQNWETDADLARAYINWSSYAYSTAAAIATTATPQTGDAPSNLAIAVIGHAAPEAFQARLAAMEIVLHNQDNREHDLLDSDDYYQFQGGLTAAVRTIRGQQPITYFGDHSRPERPQVRSLTAEISRVYRSRVINPKWIAGVMRHGYKGAFEMAATVDYLFAYDASANCVEDFMYEGVAQAYCGDRAVQQFLRQVNPWALRDMAERLLEAHQRGLWQGANPDTLDMLHAIALDADAKLEGVD